MNSRKLFYYDSATDDRRARITDIIRPDGSRVSRLAIRSGRGQGPLVLYREYTEHRGARAALRRRGIWQCYLKKQY